MGKREKIAIKIATDSALASVLKKAHTDNDGILIALISSVATTTLQVVPVGCFVSQGDDDEDRSTATFTLVTDERVEEEKP